MNNLSSYCGLVDAKIRASDKDLPVQSMNLPTENSEFNSVNVENPESEETPDVPDQNVLFNNQKFNQSLIGFAGLTLLFVIIFTVGPIFDWHFRFVDDFEKIVLKLHCLLCYLISRLIYIH